jgi:hypothetical protein
MAVCVVFIEHISSRELWLSHSQDLDMCDFYHLVSGDLKQEVYRNSLHILEALRIEAWYVVLKSTEVKLHVCNIICYTGVK